MERNSFYKLALLAAIATGSYKASSVIFNLAEKQANDTLNKHLMRPGAVETQIATTANGADWEVLVKEGKVSEKAVKSAVQIDFGMNLGSGNLAIINGHIVILTAGHALDSSAGNTLILNRVGLPNGFGRLDLGRQKNYAYIYNNHEGGDLQDFGMIVITDPDNIKAIQSVTTPDQFLTIKDLNFRKLKKGSGINGLCYPEASSPKPYPLVGGKTIGVSVTSSQYVVDGLLVYPKCSGGGLFDKNLYSGVVSMGFPPITPNNMRIPSSMVNDAYVSTLYSIGGQKGFESLFQLALNI